MNDHGITPLDTVSLLAPVSAAPQTSQSCINPEPVPSHGSFLSPGGTTRLMLCTRVPGTLRKLSLAERLEATRAAGIHIPLAWRTEAGVGVGSLAEPPGCTDD